MTRDKRILPLLSAVMVCIMMSSFGRSISIDERGLVHAMGIDSTADGYRVTMQIFQSGGGGTDTSVDAAQPNITVAVSEGRTVGEAITAARSSTGKELFFGHLQIICLGSGLELGDPSELFAFATGDKNISPSAELCMSDSTAEDLMNVRLSEEEISSESLDGLLKVSCEYSDTVSCDLKGLPSAEGCTAMPVLKVTGNQEDSSSGEGGSEVSQAVELAGTAVIGADRMLTERQALAAAMLSGKADKGHIVSRLGGANVTSALENFHTKRSLSAENGRLVLVTEVTVTARHDRQLDSKESDELAAAVSAELEKECLALQIEMLGSGEDIFGTERLIKHRYPALWLKYADDSTALLKLTVPQVRVKVKVA